MTALGQPSRQREAKAALRFGETTVTYGALPGMLADIGARLAGARRVGVWAEPRIETCLAVLGALEAGVVAVPINPKLGVRELEHVVADSRPDLVAVAPGEELPPALAATPRVDIALDAPPGRRAQVDGAPDEGRPALILYTSGTTGPPKGVVLSRRAIATNLDALGAAWAWTERDTVVQALPLFHAHGLVLGVLGAIRRGGTALHLGRFTPEGVGAAVAGGETMLFAVPTMYHRLADACEGEAELARAVGRARLLVSGSAALPAREHQRIERLTGHRIVERYGLSETLMVCSVRHDGDRRPGYVGLPLDGVDVELRDDEGAPIHGRDDETIGEVAVRGPNLFDGYLNQPEATARSVRDGWFLTGDMATVAPDGYVRIVGRRSTDLIKTGGYRVGAGEIESALQEHPAVAEAAVLGVPDDDLGERIVAWVATRDEAISERELIDHVAALLTPHKRPREVRFVESLPRNALGKVQKQILRD